ARTRHSLRPLSLGGAEIAFKPRALRAARSRSHIPMAITSLPPRMRKAETSPPLISLESREIGLPCGISKRWCTIRKDVQRSSKNPCSFKQLDPRMAWRLRCEPPGLTTWPCLTAKFAAKTGELHHVTVVVRRSVRGRDDQGASGRG